jgi:type IV pilus assembly protein PilQ
MKESAFQGLRYSQFNKNTVRIVFPYASRPPYLVTKAAGPPFLLTITFTRGLKPPETLSGAAPGARGAPAGTGPDEPPRIQTLKAYQQELEAAERLKPLPVAPPRITFDFYNADIHNVLRLIAEVGRFNLVIGDDVKGKVTMSFKEVPWDEALEILMTNYNLHKETSANGLLITTSETYYKRLQAQTKEEVEKEKLKQEREKTEIEHYKKEELRHRVGKTTWITRQFQIKYVDVNQVCKLIFDNYITEISGKISGDKKSAGTPATMEKTSRVTLIPGVNIDILPIPHTNILLVKGTEREIEYVEELVNALDRPVPQVMIEARIVEANANFIRDLGLRWGGSFAFGIPTAPLGGTIRGGDTGATSSAPTNNYAVNLPLTNTVAPSGFGGIGLSFASANFNLDIRLQAMEQQSKGRIISSPKVLTLNDHKAVIKQGKKIPVTTRDQNNAFSTTYLDAALILTVTPHISGFKKLRIGIDITNNDIDNTIPPDVLGNRTLTTKEAQTEMVVNDGDTVVIGGIMSKKETFQENRVPGLADIPLLGWLFKTRNRNYEDTELLIFLTPRIIQTQNF